jgi:hypothetical protein
MEGDRADPFPRPEAGGEAAPPVEPSFFGLLGASEGGSICEIRSIGEGLVMVLRLDTHAGLLDGAAGAGAGAGAGAAAAAARRATLGICGSFRFGTLTDGFSSVEAS